MFGYNVNITNLKGAEMKLIAFIEAYLSADTETKLKIENLLTASESPVEQKQEQTETDRKGEEPS